MGCFVHTGSGVSQCQQCRDLRYAESIGTMPGKCDGYKPSESSLKDSSGWQEHSDFHAESKLQVLAACQSWLTSAELPPVPHHSPPIIPRDAGQAGVKALLPGHTQLTAASNAQKQGVPLSQEAIFPFSVKQYFFPVLALLLSRQDL